ncbi:MAG TPA: GFA family protein [Geminicoccaceae bacterium]|nr:GFA family protein [Geminicoccaceae bacterium]
MSARLDGGCLCGSVRYTCDAEPLLTAICHCPHCQKQTSAPFSVVVAVPKGTLRIEGGTLKTFNDTGDSGQPVRRNFCGNCGSPIMSYIEAVPGMEFIKAGTLDDTSWLNPTMEIWCDTAQPWVKIDPSRQHVGRNPQLAA